MDWNAFLYESFARPVYDSTVQGYNLVNSLVYGTILLVLSFFVVFPILDRKKIKFDYKFCIGLIPYILIGTSLRAINSAGLIEGIHKTLNPLELGYWTFTPGVWFLTFGIVIFGLFLSKTLQKRKTIPFNTVFPLIGLCFSIPLLLFLFINFTNWTGFFLALVSITAIALGTAFLLKKIPFTKKLAGKFNLLVVSGQVIDGIATGFAVFFYGFTEQHPLSSVVLSVHPALFLAIKIVIVLVLLYYIEREIKRENLRGFIKTFLMVLGFATGLASVLKLGFT